MSDFLSSDGFNTYILPLIFVGLGILVNMLGKKDGLRHDFSNDFAVGSTVFLLSISTVFSDMHSSRKQAQPPPLDDYFAWLMFFLVFLLASLVNDRFNSWARDTSGNKLEQKNLLWGVFVPVVLSFVFFVIYKWEVTP